MTAVLMIGASLILLVLILWRGRSAEFRRRSEYPKFRFLANLGFERPSAAKRPNSQISDTQAPDLTPKEQHENDEP